MARMDLAASRPAAGAEWIGRAPHEELQRGAAPGAARRRPVLRAARRASSTPTPGTVLRSRDVELAFLGLIPQKFTRHPAAVPDHRPATASRRPPSPRCWCPPSARPEPGPPVVSYQCAIDAVSVALLPVLRAARGARTATGALAQFEFLLVAAALAEGWAVSVPDHEGPDGMWGAPYEPGYRVLDGLRAALSFERLGLSPDAPDRPVGLLRRRPGQRLGRRGAAPTTRPSSTSSAPCSAHRSAISGHTFRRLNGTSTAGLPAMVVAALAHVYPDLDRVIERARHRRGQGAAAAASRR